ncbi:regulator of G-protein signaling 22 [Syngnathoides biaculeatus]|uniref:regulator of G-protein signaling 22 n=1 Tax=Syngnathoides biaculeatus TaxID=300417 RepID=UPI002ADE03C6|nr:regulator of G-protein signaling 22 [Syngnathoides biaculeatus]
MRHIRSMLQQLLRHNLYMKAEKCEFHRPSILFLGFIVAEGESRMDLGKVEAVFQWPTPTNRKEAMTSLSNTSSGTFFEGPRVLDSWSNVPPQYQGYRLGSLFHQHHEIWHFMSFLQNKDACILLECWQDLEDYRRTPERNKAVRRDRFSHIPKKYLNRTNFFSSHSPATKILHLAGGLEFLKLESLSKRVAVEIQNIIRCHIEKTWLPQFLITAEFTEGQKYKVMIKNKTPVLKRLIYSSLMMPKQ